MFDVVAQLPGDLAVGSDTPAPITLLPGGSAANTAAWAARLGVPTSFVGRIGDDPLGEAARKALLEAGVDARLSVDPHRRTGTCLVLVGPDGERTMVPDAGANDALGEHPLPAEIWDGARHVHLSGYAIFRDGARPAAVGALRAGRERECGVSVDVASVAPLRAFGAQRFLDVVGTALLFANAAEAAVLTGDADPSSAVRLLAARTGEAVVKCGADGALWSDGSRIVSAAARAVRAVDTTGAGDAFAAAFLAARLRGANVASSLAAGASAAAIAVSAVGGVPPRNLEGSVFDG